MTEKFHYKKEDITATSMDGAFTKFLDEAWGTKWVEHLEAHGFESDFKKTIGCIGSLDEEKPNLGEYWQDVQKFANGNIIRFQIWNNHDGTYTGEATQLEDDWQPWIPVFPDDEEVGHGGSLNEN